MSLTTRPVRSNAVTLWLKDKPRAEQRPRVESDDVKDFLSRHPALRLEGTPPAEDAPPRRVTILPQVCEACYEIATHESCREANRRAYAARLKNR